MVQVDLRLHFLITLCHGEQAKESRLWKVMGVMKLFIAGWWSGHSKSEFGMVIAAGRLQQLHDRKPCIIRSLSAAQGCAFEMRCGIADSVCGPVVVESEALSAFAAQDLRVRDRAAIRALMVTGLAPLFQHCPGHTATTLVSLTSCKLHTVVRFLGSSQHNQLVGVGGFAGVTFVGEWER